MAELCTIEIVTKGGMTCLKEFKNPEGTALKDMYFDEFTTYAPFNWLGSRRLTLEEQENYSKQIRDRNTQVSEEEKD